MQRCISYILFLPKLLRQFGGGEQASALALVNGQTRGMGGLAHLELFVLYHISSALVKSMGPTNNERHFPFLKI